ncbi:MAG: hypothetical protein HY551_00775 [Elusimicrobia bacterium]|nr:hypothetical protein [Elusimicrobiota bacterium]
METRKFARDLLLNPSEAVARIARSPEALRASAILYIAFLCASAIFYALKPENFPPPQGDIELIRGPEESRGLWFWIKVQSWNPFLSLVWTVLLGWFSSFLKFSPLGKPLSLLTAGVMGMLPLIPILLYVNHLIPRSIFLAVWLVFLGAMIPALRKRGASSWRPLLCLVLSVNVVNLALLAPFVLSVALRTAWMYHGLEFVLLFWTLGLGTYALSRLEELSTPRAFCAIFLSMLCQFWLVFSLYFLGLVPKDILKAMMSV